MKEKRGAAVKAVLVLLENICVLTLAGLLFLGAIGVEIEGNVEGNSVTMYPFEEEKTFEKTGTFSNMFDQDVSYLIYYTAICGQFESNGVYDPDKTVDLLQYCNRKNKQAEQIQSNGTLVYKVQDLINWLYIRGFSYGEDGRLEETYLPVDNISIYSKDINAILTANGLENKATAEDAYRGYDEDTGYYTDGEDEYITDGENVEVKNDGNQDAGYEILYSYLESAAEDLSYNYNAYFHYQNDFKKNENIKYVYIPENGTISQGYCTNITEKEGSTPQEQISYITGMDTYVICDMGSFSLETDGQERNMDIENIKSSMSYYAYAFPDGGKLYVGYAGKTLADLAGNGGTDRYAQAENTYEFMQKVTDVFPVCVAVSCIGLLISTVLLIIMAGRRREGEIHLMAFDRWFTEIAAGLGVVTLGALCYVAVYFWDVFFWSGSSYYPEEVMVYVGIAVFVINNVALWFFLSLIRRIKAKTLWKDSFLNYLIRKVEGFHGYGHLVLKFWVPFILFLLVNLIFVLGFSIVGILTAFILDMVLGAFLYHESRVRSDIIRTIEDISAGNMDKQIDTSKMRGTNHELAESVNNIGAGIKNAVEKSMKDERMKTDLITNVSHDIKTPLTSIINYVDLLKRENIQDDTVRGYIEVLDAKSQRLKQLTEDLVEASKISSGNIVLQMENLDVVELLSQVLGECSEKFEQKKLQIILSGTEQSEIITADSRSMWRVMDNLLGNVIKYGMEGTRVYIDVLRTDKNKVRISVKNISGQPLNISADELTERFIRGDVSRSTEGSGLGLSIAKSLITAQGGTLEVYLDGDLFKVTIEM